MEYREFESELGNIAISRRHIEREESDHHWIKAKKATDGEEELVRNLDFSRIEDIEYEIGGYLESVNFRVEDGWKKLYFKDPDTARHVMDELMYRWKVFRQNYD